MGCDIHGFIEVKINGQWIAFDKLDINRNYLLFAKIAGVRDRSGQVIPIAQPRGLPSDLSLVAETCFEIDKEDAHSMTWLSLDEMAWVQSWYETQAVSYHSIFGYFCGNSWDRENLPKIFEDVRCVIWFDG